MINFWYEVIEVKSDDSSNPLYIGVVKANSDTILQTGAYSSKTDATIACEYFIKGINFARESL